LWAKDVPFSNRDIPSRRLRFLPVQFCRGHPGNCGTSRQSASKQGHWPRVVDPNLAEYKVNRETDPKCDAEEFARIELACRKKRSHNGPDSRDGQPYGKRADHPLAMKRDPPAANE